MHDESEKKYIKSSRAYRYTFSFQFHLRSLIESLRLKVERFDFEEFYKNI